VCSIITPLWSLMVRIALRPEKDGSDSVVFEIKGFGVTFKSN